MPFSSGPNTVNDSIVFNYDTGDVANSYKGEPTTNQYTNPAFTNSTTGWTFGSWDSGNFTYTVENILGPFGQVIPALKITRTGSSTYAHFHQNNGGKYTTGNQYTLSAYVIGAGTLRGNSQWGGVESSFTLSSQWQRVSYTVTAPNNSNYPYWAADVITQNVPMYFVFAQSEQKPHVTPFVDGTRSTTQGLLDISGRSNTITLANMTYGANNLITFDGTDDYTDVTSNLGVLDQYTIEHVSYKGSDNRMPIAFRGGPVFYQYGDNSWYYTHGGVAGEYYYPKSFTINGWGHWTIVYNGSFVQIYRNGIYEGQQATSGTANWTNGMRIGYWPYGGGYAWNGQIAVVRMYNRALQSTEIKQNYLAYKSRFNLS